MKKVKNFLVSYLAAAVIGGCVTPAGTCISGNCGPTATATATAIAQTVSSTPTVSPTSTGSPTPVPTVSATPATPINGKDGINGRDGRDGSAETGASVTTGSVTTGSTTVNFFAGATANPNPVVTANPTIAPTATPVPVVNGVVLFRNGDQLLLRADQATAGNSYVVVRLQNSCDDTGDVRVARGGLVSFLGNNWYTYNVPSSGMFFGFVGTASGWAGPFWAVPSGNVGDGLSGIVVCNGAWAMRVPVPVITISPVPTPIPTIAPTATPVPTVIPTATIAPTATPTPVPTASPTATPTPVPTASATVPPVAITLIFRVGNTIYLHQSQVDLTNDGNKYLVGRVNQDCSMAGDRVYQRSASTVTSNGQQYYVFGAIELNGYNYFGFRAHTADWNPPFYGVPFSGLGSGVQQVTVCGGSWLQIVP